MISMVALKPLTYAKKPFAIGDPFEVEEPHDRTLEVTGLAERATATVVMKTPPKKRGLKRVV